MGVVNIKRILENENRFKTIVQIFRRMMILRLKHLTYLDTRPVRNEDRLCAEAWMEGGLEAERRLREKWTEEKLEATKDSVRNLMRQGIV